MRKALLHDQRNAPSGQQRFQRPAVEKADDRALDQQARQRRHDKAQRQREKKIALVKRPGGIQAGQVQRQNRSACRETETAA